MPVPTGPALTNRTERVSKSRGKYQKGEKIKRGSIEYSKTIKNKINRKTFNLSTHDSHSGDHPPEIYTKMNVMLMEFKSMRSLLPTLTVRLLSVALKLQEGIN